MGLGVEKKLVLRNFPGKLHNPPPTAFVETPRGQAVFFSVCHVECCWVQYITWYGVYPWKLHWIYQSPLAERELHMSVPTTAASVLSNWSSLTVYRDLEIVYKRETRFLKETCHKWRWISNTIRQLIVCPPLLSYRIAPQKVFSFRTLGSHLLWNLIEGLFINFLSSKFLLQRKCWHMKSGGLEEWGAWKVGGLVYEHCSNWKIHITLKWEN